MDHKLSEILATCIEEMENGASDLEGCLRRFPQHATELRAHLASVLHASGPAGGWSPRRTLSTADSRCCWRDWPQGRVDRRAVEEAFLDT